MDLRHARTFVTVVELGTVSKAALRLRVAQPALSRDRSALSSASSVSSYLIGWGVALC
jgi:DNA-binding transcriptional LysR family regulator